MQDDELLDALDDSNRLYGNLHEARAVHQEHHGVLLKTRNVHYRIVSFTRAVELRCDALTEFDVDRELVAAYWSLLGEHGYDETAPAFIEDFRKAHLAAQDRRKSQPPIPRSN